MDAQELRQLGSAELKSKIGEWRDELFRAKFKGQSSESKDTSVFKKLRRNIARGETILREKALSGQTDDAKAVAKPVEDKPAPKAKVAKKATTRKTAAKE